jgi:hypothetical protein
LSRLRALAAHALLAGFQVVVQVTRRAFALGMLKADVERVVRVLHFAATSEQTSPGALNAVADGLQADLNRAMDVAEGRCNWKPCGSADCAANGLPNCPSYEPQP